MANISLPIGMKLDTFTSLVLTFSSANYADRFISETFPGFSYSDKLEVLSKYFDFEMIGRYIPEDQAQEAIDESDYWFTLQHLLNKARVVGVSNVVKVDRGS